MGFEQHGFCLIVACQARQRSPLELHEQARMPVPFRQGPSGSRDRPELVQIAVYSCLNSNQIRLTGCGQIC